jgi:hypothetical protein
MHKTYIELIEPLNDRTIEPRSELLQNTHKIFLKVPKTEFPKTPEILPKILKFLKSHIFLYNH